jgi:alcohol dehydrogenase class IV
MPVFAALKIPPLLVFGSGSAESVGTHIQNLGGTHPLVISDHGLRAAGLVDELLSHLNKAGLNAATYLDVETEPSIHSIPPAVAFAQDAGCDLVIGIGGGSVLDTAKTVAMLLTNGGKVEDYLGTGLVKHASLPCILIPTTSGTGAEVTPNALFYVPERRAKEAVVSPFIVPQIALVDPALTRSVPPHITAATGVDALCHAIESFTANNATKLTEPFAREAIQQIATHLRTAVIKSDDLAAREGMALGSLYAGISIANSGTNAVHALGYPLQGLNRVTHGVANSLLLPYVLDFNLLGDIPKFAEVSTLMGLPVGSMSLRDAAGECARLCEQLSHDVGIPEKMQAVGVKPEQLDELVDGAWQVQRLLRNNPRKITIDDIRTIYQQAL